MVVLSLVMAVFMRARFSHAPRLLTFQDRMTYDRCVPTLIWRKIRFQQPWKAKVSSKLSWKRKKSTYCWCRDVAIDGLNCIPYKGVNRPWVFEIRIRSCWEPPKGSCLPHFLPSQRYLYTVRQIQCTSEMKPFIHMSINMHMVNLSNYIEIQINIP